MLITDVYTKKEYTCKKCNQTIYYGKITDDDGRLYTKDGQMPNGKFGKDSNVISGAVDALVKDRLHECSKHFVEQAVANAPAPNSVTGIQQEITTTQTVQTPVQYEYLNESERVQLNDVVAKACEIDIFMDTKITKEYPEISDNPAHKGQVKNQIWSIWFTMKEQQRNGN
jgi:hypothetical protein